MLLRFLSFVVFQALGALAGWYLAAPAAAVNFSLLGLVVGGLCWFFFDMTRSLRLQHWLRKGDMSDVATVSGVWGEIADRARRLVRAKEQALRDSQNRLHEFLLALQASPNGVVLLEAQGHIEWFNQMAGTHFGLDAKRDMLQHFSNLVRDPGFASYFAAQDYKSELDMPGRDSTPSRPVKLSVQLYPYGEGRLLLLSRDVTALEQADAMRRDFVANVSHEIRTPLTVLAGFVETLQTLPLNESERVHYLALMSTQAQRMQSLVQDLLTLSRLEGSPPPSFSERVNMPALMQQLKEDGASLSSVLTGGLENAHVLVFDAILDCEMTGSGHELLSAMSNLLSNAIRYTPAGGSIRVRLALLPDDRVEFSVRDSGPGIAPEHIPRLTERFYRVDRSRSRDTGGTGLGLAIVKHVAQRHGAELHIQSTPGKGSVFSIVFPNNRVNLSVA